MCKGGGARSAVVRISGFGGEKAGEWCNSFFGHGAIYGSVGGMRWARGPPTAKSLKEPRHLRRARGASAMILDGVQQP